MKNAACLHEDGRRRWFQGYFGASATETSAATTMTTRYHMAISPGIQNTPVENGFLLGMAGKPP